MPTGWSIPGRSRGCSRMKYLLDTDWAIHCLHRVERVVARLAELRPEGVGVSIISLAELYQGVF